MSRIVSWIGHVERMDNQKLPKRIMNGHLDGGKRRGRPRKRWEDDVEEDLTSKGVGS